MTHSFNFILLCSQQFSRLTATVNDFHDVVFNQINHSIQFNNSKLTIEVSYFLDIHFSKSCKLILNKKAIVWFTTYCLVCGNICRRSMAFLSFIFTGCRGSGIHFEASLLQIASHLEDSLEKRLLKNRSLTPLYG